MTVDVGSRILRVDPVRPAPVTRPRMSNEEDRHDHVALTSAFVEVDGRPVVPVSGEMHYSRVPRSRWAERLHLLKASGVTIVSSYIFWIHHEERRGERRFDGHLDVAEFVRLAREAGLWIVLRIGPWCHGEVRNGGFPDWVLDAAPRVRTDDPAYLSLVTEWFSALGEQLDGLLGAESNVIGIQLDNELYDRPDHLVTLKRLARAAGLWAPIWTATRWGGAELPEHEVLPLYGGYTDGFWADVDAPWDDSFRDHFFFSHKWDDPGLDPDERTRGAVTRPPDPEFPPATCELAGGMATAYHRRPVIGPLDIPAIANVKLGNGSAWQGFYMYVGGVNPDGIHGMHETRGTGYPNDLPRFDYDFQAPFGSSGSLGQHHAALREHNAFLAAFGPELAPLPAALPTSLPDGYADRSTLRWALRGDASRGFVFLNRHQPYELLDDGEPVRFEITGPETVKFPPRPVRIPAGTVGRWPVGLRVSGVRLHWATASPITVLDGDVATLVVRQHAGIAAELAFDADVVAEPRSGFGRALEDGGAFTLPSGSCTRFFGADGAVDVLVLDDEAAQRAWYLGGELFLSSAPLWREGSALVTRAAAGSPVEVWDPVQATFRVFEEASPFADAPRRVAVKQLRTARELPSGCDAPDDRGHAPSDASVWTHGAEFAISLPQDDWQSGDDVMLGLKWMGDIAQLFHEGVMVADRFWDGRTWEIELTALGLRPDVELTLVISALSKEARVRFAPHVEPPLGVQPTVEARIEIRRRAVLAPRDVRQNEPAHPH